VWTAIASSFTTNWPVGFWVGVLGAAEYGVGRLWTALRRARVLRQPAGVAP
jgi:zinc/manganese transport system permease protein